LMTRTLDAAPSQALAAPAAGQPAEALRRNASEEQEPWSLLREAESDLLRRDQETLAALAELQTALASWPGSGFTASPRLGYEGDLLRLRERVGEVLPPGAKVAVVSRGDDALLDLDGRAAQHFP